MRNFYLIQVQQEDNTPTLHNLHQGLWLVSNLQLHLKFDPLLDMPLHGYRSRLLKSVVIHYCLAKQWYNVLQPPNIYQIEMLHYQQPEM